MLQQMLDRRCGYEYEICWQAAAERCLPRQCTLPLPRMLMLAPASARFSGPAGNTAGALSAPNSNVSGSLVLRFQFQGRSCEPYAWCSTRAPLADDWLLSGWSGGEGRGRASRLGELKLFAGVMPNVAQDCVPRRHHTRDPSQAGLGIVRRLAFKPMTTFLSRDRI